MFVIYLLVYHRLWAPRNFEISQKYSLDPKLTPEGRPPEIPIVDCLTLVVLLLYYSYTTNRSQRQKTCALGTERSSDPTKRKEATPASMGKSIVQQSPYTAWSFWLSGLCAFDRRLCGRSRHPLSWSSLKIMMKRYCRPLNFHIDYMPDRLYRYSLLLL